MTRNRAALVLAVCLALAVLTLTAALFIDALRSGHGLNDTGLALLLLVEGSLTGVVGGFLSQTNTVHGMTPVGAVLTITLGATAVLVTGFVLFDSLASATPAISANTSKVLAAMLGGIIGALLGFMGLARPKDADEHESRDHGQVPPVSPDRSQP